MTETTDRARAVFTVGQQIVFARSGNKAVVTRVQADPATVKAHGDVLLDVTITIHRGRRHWSEPTQFRQAELLVEGKLR